MYSGYILLIALFGSPMVGLAQHSDDLNADLRRIKRKTGAAADSVRSELKLRRSPEHVFDTYPMPNAYQQDYAAAMPNAYRGDNCVPMPNVYQDKPTERIIKVKLDSVSGFKPDSLLLRELDKLSDTLTLEKPKPKE